MDSSEMMHLGMVLVTPGQRPPILEHTAAPYGAVAVSGADGSHPPSQDEQDAARELGEQVAHVTTWLVQGRRDWDRVDNERRRASVAAAPKGPFDPSA